MRSTTLIATIATFPLLALAGCGGGTKTVSVSGPAGAAAARSTASGTTGSPTTGTGPKTAAGATSAQGGAAQPSRTATAPAFTKEASGAGSSGEGSGSASVGPAVAAVKARGYTPTDTSQYHPNQTLRVLVATRTGSADGYEQQAFFFVDGRYIGTDTSAPSAGVKVLSQSDTEVTLGYRLYQPHDPLCCARGGEASVRFQLNNGRLVALDPIPPVSSSTGTSRQ